MWDVGSLLPDQGSNLYPPPALEGEVLTTGLSGKSQGQVFSDNIILMTHIIRQKNMVTANAH